MGSRGCKGGIHPEQVSNLLQGHTHTFTPWGNFQTPINYTDWARHFLVCEATALTIAPPCSPKSLYVESLGLEKCKVLVFWACVFVLLLLDFTSTLKIDWPLHKNISQPFNPSITSKSRLYHLPSFFLHAIIYLRGT